MLSAPVEALPVVAVQDPSLGSPSECEVDGAGQSRDRENHTGLLPFATMRSVRCLQSKLYVWPPHPTARGSQETLWAAKR